MREIRSQIATGEIEIKVHRAIDSNVLNEGNI
jgi:hypothetical protein